MPNDDALRLGATGRFRDGAPHSPGDQGELRTAVTIEKGRVIFSFGKPVSWISMTPDEARELCMTLWVKAKAIDRKDGP